MTIFIDGTVSAQIPDDNAQMKRDIPGKTNGGGDYTKEDVSEEWFQGKHDMPHDAVVREWQDKIKCRKKGLTSAYL